MADESFFSEHLNDSCEILVSPIFYPDAMIFQIVVNSKKGRTEKLKVHCELRLCQEAAGLS